ncbi:low molecular weight protein-tyrosine-phosphatase [Helicobacter sp. faydin-H76]|uniref:protein-tyrosine-phosphatase n=2 Tax=Helicobacter cappadocius TaxID=3063998 RepID=A0AA90PZX3_9HELI|nr:low molecular weight protein-tyrosine-phosphatase [Helicobacter sp. faydin-H75]MDP2539568.1 low molecular weight protein-tyrosine-phosphatase [Helicobacter sp. faydin-H76]
MDILFVCLGNICRSPLAEGIARHYADKLGLNTKVDSAGTSGWHNGESPCEGSIKVARVHNIDISHLKSRKVSIYADIGFDLLVGMDRANIADLLDLGFEKHKVRKLGEFGLKNADVPDPYHYRNSDGFQSVYKMLDTGIRNLFQEYFEIKINYD